MSVAATHIAHVTVGHNRGKRRLWLEGPRLATASFTPGCRYSVATDPGGRRCVLELATNGARKVSARLRRESGQLRPIIDIAGQMIDRVFGACVEQVKITFRQGSIEIALPALTADRWRREAALRAATVATAAASSSRPTRTTTHCCAIATIANFAPTAGATARVRSARGIPATTWF